MPAQDATARDTATIAADRLAMQDTLSRYAWGYDDGDFEMLAKTFTVDGTTSGSVANSSSGWGPTSGSQDIADMLEGIRNQQTGQRRHTLHTFRYENQTETTAEVHCYVVITSTEFGVPKISTTGWYHASMTKEFDGVWRMSDLTALLDVPSG
jgi:hypothetical protein